MTKLERAAIRKILASSKQVSVESHRYETGKMIVANDAAQVRKWLESIEFKLGWNQCHARVGDMMEWLFAAKPADLKKFNG